MPKQTNTVEEGWIKVDPLEIVFFNEHIFKGFARRVSESLERKGLKLTKEAVRIHLVTIKETYHPQVIEEARLLLKELKGVEYQPETEAATV